jgi:mRNA interferase RelE/StbE
MQIELTSHASRQYKKLPPALKEIIKTTIYKLESTPFPIGYKKLTGGEGYRLRYGDYRIIYYLELKHNRIVIASIAHRREIYKI